MQVTIASQVFAQSCLQNRNSKFDSWVPRFSASPLTTVITDNRWSKAPDCLTVHNADLDRFKPVQTGTCYPLTFPWALNKDFRVCLKSGASPRPLTRRENNPFKSDILVRGRFTGRDPTHSWISRRIKRRQRGNCVYLLEQSNEGCKGLHLAGSEEVQPELPGGTQGG